MRGRSYCNGVRRDTARRTTWRVQIRIKMPLSLLHKPVGSKYSMRRLTCGFSGKRRCGGTKGRRLDEPRPSRLTDGRTLTLAPREAPGQGIERINGPFRLGPHIGSDSHILTVACAPLRTVSTARRGACSESSVHGLGTQSGSATQQRRFNQTSVVLGAQNRADPECRPEADRWPPPHPAARAPNEIGCCLDGHDHFGGGLLHGIRRVPKAPQRRRSVVHRQGTSSLGRQATTTVGAPWPRSRILRYITLPGSTRRATMLAVSEAKRYLPSSLACCILRTSMKILPDRRQGVLPAGSCSRSHRQPGS